MWPAGLEGLKELRKLSVREASLEKLVEAAGPLRSLTAVVGHPPAVEETEVQKDVYSPIQKD